MIRIFLVVPCLLLLLLLTACASGGNEAIKNAGRQNTGSLTIKFDRVSRRCEIDVTYRGQQYRQVIQDESESSDYYNALSVHVLDEPLASSSSGSQVYGYMVFGSCWWDVSERKTIEPDNRLERVSLELLVPIKNLSHNGKKILSGVSPVELLQQGFEITIPSNKREGPKSSIPHIIEDKLMQFKPSFLFTKGHDIAGIKTQILCASSNIAMLGGTLVVPASDAQVKPQNMGNSALRQYDRVIDRWEFSGTISGKAC